MAIRKSLTLGIARDFIQPVSNFAVTLAIGTLSRSLLSVFLLLAAAWKAAHQREFSLAFSALAPARLSRYRVSIRPLLLGWEVALAVALAGASIFAAALAIPAAVAALMTIAAFTLALARSTIRDGNCGCWSGPEVHDGDRFQRSLIGRNLVLFGCGVLAAFLPSGETLDRELIAPLVAGVLFGLVVLEIPSIVAVATFVPGRSEVPQ